MQTADLIPALKNSFDSCELLEGSIARCEHRFNGRLRSVFFVRAADQVPDAREVTEIQQNTVAPSYFASRDESRWNHYLVFVVPSSAAPQDTHRRALIERDTTYARKLVVPYAELTSFLERRVGGQPQQGAANANALQQAWSDSLQEAGLQAVDSDEARTSVIRAIRSGNKLSSARAVRTVIDTQPLAFLNNLTIRQFGVRSLKGDFAFGRVNLIRGVNGTGKTSLLEAIEHFLCGGTARGRGAEKLDASAIFTNSDREISFHQRPASYYQQRDLKWYGRKTTQRNRLCEGFARYNFLSADAAVDFSREEDQQDLTTVLSRVALGPEAGFTWDRIQQVHGDIGPQLGNLQREISTLSGHLEKVSARFAALNLPAPELTSRGTHIAGLLAKLGWELDQDILTTPSGFQQIAALRVVLDSVPDELPRTLESVRDELTQSEAALEYLRDTEATQRTQESKRAEIDAALKSTESLGRCVERLKEYVHVGFSDLMARIAEANREESTALPGRDVLTRLLTDTDRAGIPGVGAEVGLTDISSALKAEVAGLKRTLEGASADLEAAASRSKARELLSAQLRSVGLQIIQQHPDDGCPLCQTSMSAVELMGRIQRSIVDADSAQLAEMEETRVRLLNRLSWLLDLQGQIDSVLQAFPTLSGVSLESAIKMVDDAEVDRARKSAGRSALLASMDLLQNQEFSLQELLGLLSRCESDIDAGFNSLPLSQDLLQRADEHVATRRSALVAELSNCLERERELSSALVERSIALTGGEDVVAAKFKAARRAASMRLFIKAFGDLPGQVQVRALGDLNAFVDLARMTYSQVGTLSEELRDTHSRNVEMAALSEEIRSIEQAMSKLGAERTNLKNAHDALERIISEQSLERGLTDFLSSNLLSIQSIFQRIHAPNELRLSNLAGCELVRTAGNSPTTLSQISTGQRAALVLSVFLTLNMSLRSGPPMMLVDDPIAHVDDMNSLALLDYLADIAEAGQRQVFFATADEKLANLFEKKMAFLGQDFRVVPLERSTADGTAAH